MSFLKSEPVAVYRRWVRQFYPPRRDGDGANRIHPTPNDERG